MSAPLFYIVEFVLYSVEREDSRLPRRAGQEPLTRDRIVSAALQLIDRDGLDALSMRRLGGELGVDPMAIYHHVPNKDALLHAVVRHVLATMAAPATRGTWQARVMRWAKAYRGVAETHPNLVLRIVTDPGAVAVAAVQANEALFGALDASGLAPGDVLRAADLVVDYVNGYVLGAATQAGVHDEASAAFQTELDAQPEAAVAVQRRLFESAGHAPRDSFTFGLETILAGLTSRVRGGPSSA